MQTNAINLQTTTNAIEQGFSPLKYLTIALVIGAVAGTIFPICFPAAFVLLGITSWYLWSAAIIVIDKKSSFTLIHQLYAKSMDVHTFFVTLALAPLSLFKKYRAPKGGPKDAPPIVFLHGFLSFAAMGHYFRNNLCRRNCGEIHLLNQGSFKSIEFYAQDAVEKVNKIFKDREKNGNHEKKITLVGHSRGGLVLSLCGLELVKQGYEVKVITISSPFGGSPSARFMPIGIDAKQMRPGSPFLEQLTQKISAISQHIQFFHIGSTSDALVPNNSAIPSSTPPERQLLLNNLGHRSIVLSSRVAKQVNTWAQEPYAS